MRPAQKYKHERIWVGTVDSILAFRAPLPIGCMIDACVRVIVNHPELHDELLNTASKYKVNRRLPRGPYIPTRKRERANRKRLGLIDENS